MFNSEILKKSFENEISLLKDIIENPNKKNNNSRKNEQTVIYNLQVKNLQLSELVIILMSKLHDYAYKSGNSELIEDFKIKNKEIEILLGYTQGDPHE